MPKGDKPRDYVKKKNWCLISLLNVTYKIRSASITNRVKTVLPNLINEDQTGRYVRDNDRLLCDILFKNKKPTCVASLERF